LATWEAEGVAADSVDPSIDIAVVVVMAAVVETATGGAAAVASSPPWWEWPSPARTASTKARRAERTATTALVVKGFREAGRLVFWWSFARSGTLLLV